MHGLQDAVKGMVFWLVIRLLMFKQNYMMVHTMTSIQMKFSFKVAASMAFKHGAIKAGRYYLNQ